MPIGPYGNSTERQLVSDPDLEPCPFCGSDDVYIEVDEGCRPAWYATITCAICACSGPKGQTVDEAVVDWNVRYLTEGEL